MNGQIKSFLLIANLAVLACQAPAMAQPSNTATVSLYLLYNQQSGDNFTTTDPRWQTAHAGDLVGNPPYRYVRSEGKIFANPGPGLVPLMSWYSETRKDHFTTTDPTWRVNAAEPSYGARRLEGYVYDPGLPQPYGTVPLYTLWSPSRHDNFLTSDPAWRGVPGQLLGNPDYTFARVEGFLQPAAAIAAPANQLTVDFYTGGDDLRGSNDNVHLILILRAGSPVRFDNANAGERWLGNSVHSVVKVLPAAVHIDDIVGVRLETTFRGGIDGDNWNLDRLVVRTPAAGGERVLFDGRGTPLLRFTGDVRVHDFLFSATRPPATGAVMTTFKPEVHGFKFVNQFTNLVLSEFNFTTSGLCGGMVYGVLDYFNAHTPIPQQDYMPAEGTPLQSYLYQREVNSVESNLDKWAEVGFNPFGARNREFFNWGLQVGTGRLGELRERLDHGIPVPLGLQACGNDCGCPGGCPASHQVLAIGYKLGNYIGDLSNHAEDVEIYVYDPNAPNQVRTLTPNVAGAMYGYKEDASSRWRTYFVNANYRPVAPLTVGRNSNELVVTFVTGDDDLRGGNDNVHVVLLLRNGRLQRFDNVNKLRRWYDRSSQTVSLPLPGTLRFEDLAGIRLETTFSGGIGGDNWNLNELTVKAHLGNDTRTLLTVSGAPLVRFTAALKTKDFSF